MEIHQPFEGIISSLHKRIGYFGWIRVSDWFRSSRDIYCQTVKVPGYNVRTWVLQYYCQRVLIVSGKMLPFHYEIHIRIKNKGISNKFKEKGLPHIIPRRNFIYNLRGREVSFLVLSPKILLLHKGFKILHYSIGFVINDNKN